MSINRFEILNKAVELGSLTRAGEALNLTQSAISHAISNLEKEYGFPLLIRNRSGITVTLEGERTLQYMREILQVNEKLQQEVAAINGLEVGTVRVGTFTSVSTNWLPGIMKLFQQEYPNITLKLFEGNYFDIENWLVNGKIDCGFVTLPSNEGFNILPLKTDRMLCILSEKHPYANQERISFKQLESEPFIMQKVGGNSDVRRIFSEHNVKPTIKYELADDHAIVSMVQNELGISVLPELVLTQLPKGVNLLGLERESFRLIGIASGSQLAPATARFISTVKLWVDSL
ncbi:LysR family transcriptional regulator [Alkalihalobacillus sp. MEB130]|uniref:LysR family transcriptional regulator n=1 Tax=Alkalihalobacillus sp. MEB130 TaxID=2976704 RepID=UPI0028DD8BCD|nr:LysR family transcriptional regulator [Alkalihalobacillus sp. MEB130]MDT8860114.1 LysR family transcriptional regulator [Alkalihalobacillus sp. MEB130]